MNRTITVCNASGNALKVAMFVFDPNQPGASPLIWKSISIPDNANNAIEFNTDDFGIGWGSANTSLASGAKVTMRQVQALGPVGTVSAPNCAPLTYVNGGYSIGAPYFNRDLGGNQMALSSDGSFEVAKAVNARACAGLFLKDRPVMVYQLIPNSIFLFEPLKAICYLTVTDAVPGTVISPPPPLDTYGIEAMAVSFSNPTAVTFPRGVNQRDLKLTSTLAFVLTS